MHTQFKQILSITGEPGLFRALNFGSRGVIVETLDEKKIQSLRSFHRYQIISLTDISVYSKTEDQNISLYEIFEILFNKYKDGISQEILNKKLEVRKLIEDAIPNLDGEKVKDHEFKKILTWYNILLKQYPSVLEEISKTK